MNSIVIFKPLTKSLVKIMKQPIKVTNIMRKWDFDMEGNPYYIDEQKEKKVFKKII